MIAIIDYGRGNLFSVAKGIAACGGQVTITGSAKEIKAADGVILPGVGSFGDCMENLQQRGLTEVIGRVVESRVPFLGICLGLQLLFESSEESPQVPGLGILKGTVKKIVATNYKVPHVGWNRLEKCSHSFLLPRQTDGEFFYFVHSYHAVPQDKKLITSVVQYGEEITASVGQDNIQAVQFHPEKSGRAGLALLQRFKEACE